MEMVPPCSCCGGRIDVSTMRCMYCDTQYHIRPSSELVNIVKLETLRTEMTREKINEEIIQAMRGVGQIRG